MPRKAKDLTNQRFGRWIVIKRTGRKGTYWLCQCDCGNEKEVAAGSLTKGDSQSCGCLAEELKRHRLTNYKHGDTNKNAKLHGLYEIWHSMKTRCNSNGKNTRKRYKDRGIKVCEKWKSYITFKAWALANGYKDGLSLDRKDPDKNYEPSNCQWITRTANSAKVWPDQRRATERVFMRGILIGFLRGCTLRKTLLVSTPR